MNNFFVIVDPYSRIPELDENNNLAQNKILVQNSYTDYTEGFEVNYGSYEFDFDVPEDFYTGGYKECYSEITDEDSYKGNQSLKLFLDGTSDDGTVWVERWIPVPKNSKISVAFSFAFGNHPAMGCMVSHYVGINDPEVEQDFSDNWEEHSYNWKVYSYYANMTTGDYSRIWVAAGFSAVWETWFTHYLDSMKITVNTVSDPD
jgi:hypothetical protein